jgi:hypothetical protein
MDENDGIGSLANRREWILPGLVSLIMNCGGSCLWRAKRIAASSWEILKEAQPSNPEPTRMIAKPITIIPPNPIPHARFPFIYDLAYDENAERVTRDGT